MCDLIKKVMGDLIVPILYATKILILLCFAKEINII